MVPHCCIDVLTVKKTAQYLSSFTADFNAIILEALFNQRYHFFSLNVVGNHKMHVVEYENL